MQEQTSPAPTPGSVLTGPLLDPNVLASFHEVTARALANVPGCSSVPVAALRPRISCVPDLLDQAAEVLNGNPLAAERFRQTLRSFGGGTLPTPAARGILTRLESPTPSQGGNDPEPADPVRTLPPSRLDRLLDPHRLEWVAAASVYAARDREELAVLMGSLQLSLLGVDEMQTLLELALAGAEPPSLASAFHTAVQVLRPMGQPFRGPGDLPFEPNWPGTPGWGIPGFGQPLPRFGWPLPGNGGSPTPPEAPTPFVPPRGVMVTDFFERCLTTRIIPEMHRRGIGFIDVVTASSGHYTIHSVEPPNACPGDTITIRGSNFSGTTAVHFANDRGGTVAVSPASVSDDTVTVDLPDTARTGPVSLYIPITVRLCLITSVMARPGTAGDIRVGRPSILRFGLRHGTDCVARGDAAALVWSVVPDDAEVTITRQFGTGETEIASGLPARGERVLSTSRTPGTYRYRIDVRNPEGTCGDASQTVSLQIMPRSVTRFVIDGVEQTQGIQVFSLASPPPEPNNSIGLIANMDTVIRVFVRTTFPATGGTARVTGALTWNGITYMPINAVGPFIQASRSPNRRRTNDSLNFLIPAADAAGSGEVSVEVFTTGTCSDHTETWSETLTWVDRPPLPVTVRRIAESDLTVLSVAQARALVTEAFGRIPSPKTAITIHPGVHQIREGTTEDNYCTDGGFYQLALSIAYEHNDNEGYPPAHHSTSWLGLFSRLDCDVSGMMAWPSTSTCISEPDVETIAHELMHTVGLGHTKTSAGEDCENVGQPVACHWLHELTDGALNHIPFDIANNRAVTGARDLQSYRASPKWLSATLWVLGRTLMDTRY